MSGRRHGGLGMGGSAAECARATAASHQPTACSSACWSPGPAASATRSAVAPWHTWAGHWCRCPCPRSPSPRQRSEARSCRSVRSSSCWWGPTLWWLKGRLCNRCVGIGWCDLQACIISVRVPRHSLSAESKPVSFKMLLTESANIFLLMLSCSMLLLRRDVCLCRNKQ